MPVENMLNINCSSSQRTSSEGPLALRAAFVEAVKVGRPHKEIAVELGIALSTTYKWAQLWRNRKGDWLSGTPITRAKRISGMTAEQTRERVITASLENPALSVRKLQRLLEQSHHTKLSVGLVHNILAAAKLGTKERREAALFARHQGQAPGTPVLTKKQLRAIEGRDIFATLPFRRPSAPGQLFIHDIVVVRADFLTGGGRLHLLIDAHDGRTFSKFVRSIHQHPTADFLEATIQGHALRPRYVYTDHGYEFLDSGSNKMYRSVAHRYNIAVRHHASTNQRRNPLVQMVWTALRRFLLDERADDCYAKRNDPDALDALIRECLDGRTFESVLMKSPAT